MVDFASGAMDEEKIFNPGKDSVDKPQPVTGKKRLSQHQENDVKLARAAVLLCLLISPLAAQEIKDTSYITSTGERVLRLECVVPIARQEAWKLFTTAEGLKKWIAPVVAIDFRVGGQLLTNYDKTKLAGDPGTIRLPIVNYLEAEMLTLKVELNESFAARVVKEDQDLQEIIQFFDLGKGKTRLISSMIGWGKGPEWDKTYAFFAKGNAWTYKELLKLFR
ncbi:MAG: hypothetical protein QOJ64_2492 [Acidobacteriota bacterium]|jgi:uncharacterized protein YndB with AHSA1/START domain|nr:hypothetical protein [Acidobacteriota bacterium]